MKEKRYLYKSELFDKASHSRFLPNFFLAAIIFAVLWCGSRFLAQYAIDLFTILFDNKKLPAGIDIYIVNRLVKCSAIIGAFLLWVRFVEKRKVSTIGFQTHNLIKKYFFGFFLGFLLISLNIGFFVILGVAEFVKLERPVFNISTMGVFVALLCGWVIQSASEELAVRGWLLPVLGAKYNVVFSILTTSMVFAVIHLLNPNVTILSFVNIFLSGMFLALYAIVQEGLWGVCGFHFAWNLALTNIYGFEISGYPSMKSLLKFKVDGPEFITGGGFGPEAGILVTIFLCAGIVILSTRIFKSKTSRI